MWGTDPKSDKASPAADIKTVATASTDKEGRYSLRLNPPPMMEKAASRNGGWVNFTLFVFTPDGTSRPVSVTRKLGDAGWENPEIREYNSPESLVSTTIGYEKSGKPINGQMMSAKEQDRVGDAKPLACFIDGITLYQAFTDVVDFTNSFPADGRWSYGESADSQIDVGVNVGQQGWGVSGSATIANQGTGRVGLSYSDNFSTFGQTQFEYNKIEYVPGSDCPLPYTEIRAVDWSGGAEHQGPGTLETCVDEPFNQHAIDYPKDSDFRIERTTAGKISGAVNIANTVDLGATSGFSENVTMEWKMTRGAVEFCGRDDEPAGSDPGPGVIVNNPIESAGR